MHDLVIDNAVVVDGLGGPAREGGVAVKDGRIAAVGPAACCATSPRDGRTPMGLQRELNELRRPEEFAGHS